MNQINERKHPADSHRKLLNKQEKDEILSSYYTAKKKLAT